MNPTNCGAFCLKVLKHPLSLVGHNPDGLAYLCWYYYESCGWFLECGGSPASLDDNTVFASYYMNRQYSSSNNA